MLVFIDDSGDPGFKIDRGSTRFFVIALVIFNDELEAEKTAVSIKELRRSLNFSDNTEFKFHKSRNDVREKFLKAISKFDFKFRCVVVDKTLIKSELLRGDKSSFYRFFIKTAIEHSPNIVNAKIKIDGSGDREFRKSFLSYLKKELNGDNTKIIKNCKLVDSKENVLIQLADMVAGSVHRSLNKDKKDCNDYLRIIKRQKQDIWNFK